MTQPLYVAFVWHMHQPCYREEATGDYVLPWTRLHATKDYLHMAEVLADFPAIHATFNLVPSLVEQLNGYASGEATDKALRISLKEALSPADKEYLLSFCFSVNAERVINRYPPYRELLRQRDEALGNWRRFPDEFWTDLIVWFNLAWFDPGYVQRDADLCALAQKRRGFTHADVRLLAAKSRHVAGAALAAYRRLADRNQIELCTSPYFHPILPLLIDSTSAHEASPNLPLPPNGFAYPEDAIEQVRRAIQAHEKTFGRMPLGMWPSEGAVSQAVVDLLARNTDLRWIASDEAILSRSVAQAIVRDQWGHVVNPGLLYQPYELVTNNRPSHAPLVAIFRDHVLADRIGFVYRHMDSRAAAEDLVQQLHHARAALGETDEPYLLSIILDGENCWEYYENNGDDFLRRLYGLLSADPELRTVTVSEYLDQFMPRSAIPRLAAGSWIGGDMLTWIGEPAQNAAWDRLARARERLVTQAATHRATSLDVIGQAWQELYIAEGSDWFWWYSSRNNPQGDAFDVQFRGHLAAVHRHLGLPVPEWLAEPIYVARPADGSRSPTAFVTPMLTGSVQAHHTWAQAGYVDAESSSAAMQRSETVLRRLYYGYDAHNLYLRLEMNGADSARRLAFSLRTPQGRTNRVMRLLPAHLLPDGEDRGWSHEIDLDLPAGAAELLRADGYEGWHPAETLVDCAVAPSVAEMRIPFKDLGLHLGETMALAVAVGRDGVAEERCPVRGELGFRLMRFSAAPLDRTAST